MKNKKNMLYAWLAVFAIALSGTVGATLAWLVDTTGPVENTFTVGNIDIELAETTGEGYKMIPGNTLAKDPKVTIIGGSEACWLFVKVEPSANASDFLEYDIDLDSEEAGYDGWVALSDEAGVYYREVEALASNQEFYVLAGNDENPNGIVTVKDSVTKAMMDAIKEGTANEPTLTFTAYAIQKDNITSAADAWAKIDE